MIDESKLPEKDSSFEDRIPLVWEEKSWMEKLLYNSFDKARQKENLTIHLIPEDDSILEYADRLIAFLDPKVDRCTNNTPRYLPSASIYTWISESMFDKDKRVYLGEKEYLLKIDLSTFNAIDDLKKNFKRIFYKGASMLTWIFLEERPAQRLENTLSQKVLLPGGWYNLWAKNGRLKDVHLDEDSSILWVNTLHYIALPAFSAKDSRSVYSLLEGAHIAALKDYVYKSLNR